MKKEKIQQDHSHEPNCREVKNAFTWLFLINERLSLIKRKEIANDIHQYGRQVNSRTTMFLIFCNLARKS